MIRKKKISKTEEHRPLYREIIPMSLRGAWRERWLWPLALIAGLIQTGGILDAFLVSTRETRIQAVTLFDASWSQSFQVMWLRVTRATDWIDAILAGQNMLLAAVVVITTLALALVAQGALVFGIGGMIRGRRPTLQESMRAGTQVFGRILALNVITLGLMWLARFLMLLPLALYSQEPNAGLALTSVATTVLYIVTVLSLTAIHFFSLNAIVLQDTHVTPAIERAAEMLRSHWLTVIEIALILFGIGMLTLLGALGLFFAMWLPLLLMMLGAVLMGMGSLFGFLYFVSVILFFVVMLVAGAFNLSFQYRAWQHLYMRLGEGGVLAKLHRWLHALMSYGQ